MKVNNTKRRFSMDPMNMTGFNGKRHCGLVNEKGCGIVPTKDNKGFTLLTKNKKKLNKPAQMVTKRTFKNKPRVALHKLEKTMMGYRDDLKESALIKASCILEYKKAKRQSPAKKH